MDIDSLSEENRLRELDGRQKHIYPSDSADSVIVPETLYQRNDAALFLGADPNKISPVSNLFTLEELLAKDKQREADGFPKRIRIGKIVKPVRGNKNLIVVVPTTTEPKFYHDNSVTEENDSDSTGGSGDGEEGEVIGEQPLQPEEGEGEASGAGQGSGGEHDVLAGAFDLGKMLTEKFQLPNLKLKGNKRSFTKYRYDLTDINRGFGQVLDLKASLKKIIQTNILLGKIKAGEPFNPEDLLINPQDQIYRIFSKEKDYESQAVVFFVRDFSGSMQGKPTEAVVSQHLLIYSWLVYQYQNNVMTRFILHDTEAKEVPDFYTYYKSSVAGGTNIYPAFELVNKIVENERLAKDYNIYVFHGTDGDDWESDGQKMLEALKSMLVYANRVGITVAKNNWSASTTIYENYLEHSGLLKEKADLFRLDSFSAESYSENRLIEGIKKLIS